MEQLEAIRRLMGLKPPVVLVGGWAEDAVLHGRAGRLHEDIDCLVSRNDLETLLQQVEDIGFTRAGVRVKAHDGEPQILSASGGGFELELIVYERHEGDGAFFEVPAPGGAIRVWLPEDAFVASPARLNDVLVHTVSPLALYQLRDEVFGGRPDKDKAAQAALKARFFADVPAAQLTPRTDRLGSL